MTIACDSMYALSSGLRSSGSVSGTFASSQTIDRANTAAPDGRSCHDRSLKDSQTNTAPSAAQATLSQGPPSCTGAAIVSSTKPMPSDMRLR